MTTCYQVLELIPPVSMAELKVAYRKAAALHHPDRGGSHKMMVVVNDAYEQAKWEVLRATDKPNRHQRTSPKPKPNDPLATWTEVIDELIRRQKQRGYKKAWVTFKLLSSRTQIPLDAWIYLADKFNYMEKWAGYKFAEWKPPSEREDLN
ncbi:DnaJ domain-containing protein [Chamaesiphon sp.]|uniref:J domain-containing protein n=1 Tax=Chamaesiphon sp. TaxID=2814140 RepID=UPI00359345EC